MQDIFDHMNWFNSIARFGLLIWAAVNVCQQNWDPLLFVIVLLLIFFDFGRLRLQAVRSHPAVFSILSIVLCMILLTAKRTDMIQVYYFFLLHDIFTTQRRKLQNSLIAVHFVGFITAECYAVYVVEHQNFWQNFSDVFALLAIYAILLYVFAVIHYFKWDRDKLKILNTKLIEYSFQEREYLIASERSHISQELHDSLGHSLMAALMNVRYLKAIQDKSPEEKSGQVDEVEEILKECVENLRGSVYNLKELDENINLREEVGHIIDKFDELGLIEIHLDSDDKIENVPKPLKSVLYKTIREGITNSIRHGNASSIRISIRYVDDRIELLIKDNGCGCENIQRSYGLNGIEDRIKEVGGEVSFSGAKNKGFSIKALLPGGNKE